MDRALAGDPARLPELLRCVRDVAVREVNGLSERPVARLGPAPDPLTVDGVGGEAALTRFAERWSPGFSPAASEDEAPVRA